MYMYGSMWVVVVGWCWKLWYTRMDFFVEGTQHWGQIDFKKLTAGTQSHESWKESPKPQS